MFVLDVNRDDENILTRVSASACMDCGRRVFYAWKDPL